MEYDEDLYLTQTREYTNEKRIIKSVKSQSISRLLRLEKKVLAFKSNPKDIHHN
jgi:hypothetical protein